MVRLDEVELINSELLEFFRRCRAVTHFELEFALSYRDLVKQDQMFGKWEFTIFAHAYARDCPSHLRLDALAHFRQVGFEDRTRSLRVIGQYARADLQTDWCGQCQHL